MNNQDPSLHSLEIQQGESSQPAPDANSQGEGLHPATDEMQNPRRRRSRDNDGGSKSRSGRNRSGKSKGKSTETVFHQAEKLIVWGCCLLGLLVVFAVGFYFGQKSGSHAEEVNQILQQDAPFPSSEADGLIDAAFTAFQMGNYREAMSKFQKVEYAQPTLVGIDYLIAESAYRAGENVLAQEAAGHSLSKNEFIEESRVLLALLDLAKSKSGSASDPETQQLADPSETVNTKIKQLVASHLGSAKAFEIWGDFLRSNGQYRSAVDVLHKGSLRADPVGTQELLSAKEQLARLQDRPVKTAPSLSEVTSMTGEQALVAALASLQLKQEEGAASFLERARNLYSPMVFRELMNDIAFADYRMDPQVKQFFKSNRP